jgi:hypothetical protein
MIGRHIFPLTIEYYIDDIEVRSLRSRHKFNSVFDELVNAEKTCIHSDGSMTAIIFPEKDGNESDAKNGNSPKNVPLKVISYQKKENILVSMELKDIKDEPIGTRYTDYSLFSPVDFFYRGLRVSNVKESKQMLYPCWDIKAYAFFGEAEEYVEINRNHLLVNKVKEVYKRVAESADKALGKLWEDIFDNKLHGTPLMSLKQDAKNALAFSYLFQFITEKSKPFSGSMFGFSGFSKLKEALGRITGKIAGLAYDGENRLVTDNILLEDIFEDGLESCWFINKNSYRSQEAVIYECFRTNIPDVITMDIFTDYLKWRGLNTFIEKFIAFKGLGFKDPYFNKDYPYFTLAYKILLNSKAMPVTMLTDKLKEFWFHRIYDYCYIERHRGHTTEELGRLLIFPVLLKYEFLCVNNLPEGFCPPLMDCFGQYIIAPFSCYDIIQWLECGSQNTENAKKNRQSLVNNIKNKISRAAEAQMKINPDLIYRDTPQGQLAHYIYEQRHAEDDSLTLEYIGKLLCNLVDDFFSVMTGFEDTNANTKRGGVHE